MHHASGTIVGLAVFLSGLCISGSAWAADDECWPKKWSSPESYTGAKSSFAVVSTAAPSSSSTWGGAATSGTSGCGGGSTALRLEPLPFVALNRDALTQALAQGSGGTLEAMAVLLEVPVAARDAFTDAARRAWRAQAAQAPDTAEHLLRLLRDAADIAAP